MVRAPVAARRPGKWLARTRSVETEFGWRWRRTWPRSRRPSRRGVVRLLPAFDQYVVAAPRDERATTAPERIYRPGGWFSPVLLVDGVMAGVWSRRTAW